MYDREARDPYLHERDEPDALTFPKELACKVCGSELSCCKCCDVLKKAREDKEG